VSTQLRLVEPPAPAPRTRAAARRQPPADQSGRRARAATLTGARRTRPARPVRWGDWHLDARTRSVGRAGVAAARRALEEAAASEELSRAS